MGSETRFSKTAGHRRGRTLAAAVLAGLTLGGAPTLAAAQDAVPRLLNRIEGWFTPDRPQRPAAAPELPPLPRAKPELAALGRPGLPWQPLPPAKPATPEPAAVPEGAPVPEGKDGGRSELPAAADPTDSVRALLGMEWVDLSQTAAFAPPETAPLPPAQAEMLSALRAGEGLAATGGPAPINLATVDPGQIPLPKKSPFGDLACQAELTALGVTFDRVGRVEEGACGMDAAVRVTAIATGAVAVELTQPAQLDCATARRLAVFVRDTVQPTAATTLQNRITGLRVAASYACRSRNSQPDAKLSEHALGKAIDISGFRIGDDRWVSVGDAENSDAENAFLAGVRKAACGPFKTVLGPGSDAFHNDHLHFDLARRRNGSMYCR